MNEQLRYELDRENKTIAVYNSDDELVIQKNYYEEGLGIGSIVGGTIERDFFKPVTREIIKENNSEWIHFNYDRVENIEPQSVSLSTNRSNYVQFRSEYRMVSLSVEPLLQNLYVSCANGASDQAETYWTKIKQCYQYKEHAESTLGDELSDYVLVEKDEFDEVSPDREPVHEWYNEQIEPFIEEQRITGTAYLNMKTGLRRKESIEDMTIGVKSCSLFRYYSTLFDKLPTENRNELNQKAREFDNMAWSYINYFLPRLDNNHEKMKNRLKFDGLFSLISDMLNIKRDYLFVTDPDDFYQQNENQLVQQKKDKETLERINDLYSDYNLRKSEPTTDEQQIYELVAHKYNADQIEIHRHLHLKFQ